MKTTALRLYGAGDLRVESFDLPALRPDEIAAHIVSDSLCMSSYKAAVQGAAHRRVPDDVAENPVILGHEFCGYFTEIGEKWAHKYKKGHKFVMQTALSLPENPFAAPGYSFPYVGGDATDIIIPSCVMERDCLLTFGGDAFFTGSLIEPYSCVIGGFHVNYHLQSPGSYVHEMGIREGGSTAILAGAGPMGMAAVNYAVHCDRRPALLAVTDIDPERLARAERLLPPAEAAEHGVRLVYLNTARSADPAADLLALTGGSGYDDVYVLSPAQAVLAQADRILGYDGCLNFFAGPTDRGLRAPFNFYNVHYQSVHVAGNSGGNADDMREALSLISSGRINPSAMVTHILGLDSAADVTLRLPQIPGGKKLVYTNIRLPLTALADLPELGRTDPMMRRLADAVAAHGGLWCREAEEILLREAEPIA